MGLLRKDRKFDSSPSTTRAKPFLQAKDSPVDPFFKPAIQAKLKVGKSNDKFEQEADRVADRVVSKSKGDTIQKKGGDEEIQQKPIASEVTPLVQKSEVSEEEPVQKSAAEEEKVQKQEEVSVQMKEEEEAVQAKGEEEESVQMQEEEEAVQAKGEEEESVQMQEEEEAVQAKGEEEESVQMQEEEEAIQAKGEEEESVQMQEEEEAVQTKLQPNGSKGKSSSIESRLNSSKGGGQKLSGKAKHEMESGFGSDFSNVNIHTDQNAAQLSKDLGAKAFAHGNDIYFNKGQFNPESSEGKHLLAHELTHTIQQKGMVQKKVQRKFKPEDAAVEMIGKQFKFNTDLTLNKIRFPKNTTCTITVWVNSSLKVSVTAVGSDKKPHSFNVQKRWLSTSNSSKAGLYEYSAGVDSQSSTVDSGVTDIENHKKKKSQYVLYKNVKGYEKELKRLEDRQKVRDELLNKKLIQETMYNSFDKSIKKWTDYYNKKIAVPNKYGNLDANIVKSMIFQESQMGTSGKYLYKNPRYEGDPMTRFNLMQSIDSSGSILTLMMNEMDPKLATKYKINDVTKDMHAAKKKRKELVKKESAGNLTDADSKELKEINRRSNDGKSWDYFYWTDNRFYDAWKEFNKKPAGIDRNLDYDFWIRTGIRWLFKKRGSVSNWAEAIRAFNGSGSGAKDYKYDVITRRDKAKTASNSNEEFIPKHDY